MSAAIKTARARSTGTTVEVWRAQDFGVSDPGGDWVTVCEHGSSIHHQTRKLALHHSAAPQEWCEQGCRAAFHLRNRGSLTLQCWAADFEAMARIVPEEWIEHHDGLAFIAPEHADDPRAQLYLKLTQVGYAKGWL